MRKDTTKRLFFMPIHVKYFIPSMKINKGGRETLYSH